MELSAPLAEPAEPRSSWTALRRIGPYLRPVRLPAGAAALATLGALLCGLAIPLVTQRIVDGLLSTGDAGAAVRPILLVGVLGAAEAALFYARRKLIARPTALVESRMRADLLAHLLRLPVSFHDRWLGGSCSPGRLAIWSCCGSSSRSPRCSW